MTIKKILTDDLSLVEQLREYAADNGYSHNDYADTMSMAADALERHQKSVLQSPEMQALRKDAAMLDWLDAKNDLFKMGWSVRLAPAGNVSVSSVVQLGGSVTPIRAAINAAMEQKT